MREVFATRWASIGDDPCIVCGRPPDVGLKVHVVLDDQQRVATQCVSHDEEAT